MHSLNKNISIIFLLFFLLTQIHSSYAQGNKGMFFSAKESAEITYQGYLDFFEEVYATVVQNYYKEVSRNQFNKFLTMFDTEIYGKLKTTGKSSNYIKWRSSAYLIDHLKSSEDKFSAFFPPEPAKEYAQVVLGKRIDMGIKGALDKDGYRVSHVEPRSDSYKLGLRNRDIIKKIDENNVLELTDEKVEELLNPLEGARLRIEFLSLQDNQIKVIEPVSKEYFHQTVFLVPVPVEDIYCLEIRRFNRKTSEDMFNYLTYIRGRSKDSSLILDLRGNPGGPPLAAREISAFFLEPGRDFAYFQKRNRPKSLLDVPRIAQRHRYEGPIVILVNEKSGSASELFSGVMQNRGRAVLMGRNTAGQVLLKSMFHFDDESMVLLVTGRGHYPDGKVFSFNGVTPNRIVGDEQQDELVRLAASYLLYLKNNKNE